MLALNIEDRYVENIFLDGFNGNKEKFFEFIKKSYENLQPEKNSDDAEWDLDFWGGRTKKEVECDYDESVASGLSDLTHDEVFDMLIKKHDIN